MESKSNLERFMWWVVICTSMVLSIVMVMTNLVYFMDYPLITTIETTVVQEVSTPLHFFAIVLSLSEIDDQYE